MSKTIFIQLDDFIGTDESLNYRLDRAEARHYRNNPTDMIYDRELLRKVLTIPNVFENDSFLYNIAGLPFYIEDIGTAVMKICTDAVVVFEDPTDGEIVNEITKMANEFPTIIHAVYYRVKDYKRKYIVWFSPTKTTLL